MKGSKSTRPEASWVNNDPGVTDIGREVVLVGTMQVCKGVTETGKRFIIAMLSIAKWRRN